MDKLPYKCKELINLFALNKINDFEPLNELNKIMDYQPCEYSLGYLQNTEHIYNKTKKRHEKEIKEITEKMIKKHIELFENRFPYFWNSEKHLKEELIPSKTKNCKCYKYTIKENNIITKFDYGSRFGHPCKKNYLNYYDNYKDFKLVKCSNCNLLINDKIILGLIDKIQPTKRTIFYN